MKPLKLLLCFFIFLNISVIKSYSQTIDYAVHVDKYYGDLTIVIDDYYGDETWVIVGACKNKPNLTITIDKYYGDKTIVIDKYFGDKKVCITNAHLLDEDTLRQLKLIK